MSKFSPFKFTFAETAEGIRLGDVTEHGTVTDYIKGCLDGNADLIAKIEFDGNGPMIAFPHEHVFICN